MIIAFVAPKQYGKSTACNILKEYWGDSVVQINFKDALIAEIKQNFPDLLVSIIETENDICSYMNDVGIQTFELCFEDLFTVKPPLIRTLMQNYGTEVRRKDDPDYWVCKYLNSAAGRRQNIVTDDVRFLNEAQAVKEHGGILIRLDRTDKTSTDTHVSETEQVSIKCDYTITVGEGEFDELRRQLLAIISAL